MPDRVRQEGFWQSWETPLSSFVEATGLTASLYDLGNRRRLGPMLGSPLAAKLAESTLWASDGPGTALEQSLVTTMLARGEPAAGRFEDLAVSARPVRLDHVTLGALVVGWVPDRFTSTLECTRLARSIDLDPAKLWRIVRAETPCSPARFAVLMKLVDTLLFAHAAHLVSIERAEELTRVRDRFLARAAHELRTPLAAIGMRIELMRNATSSEATRGMLDKIANNVETESRLIEDLIEAGRTLTGQLRVTMAPLSLLEVVRECVENSTPAADTKNLRLAFDHGNVDEGMTVDGDATRLRQAIANLITNAIKFTPSGGEVAVRLARSDTNIDVEVSDTGQGLEREQLERVFDPFVKSERNNEAGLGLGLAISRQIVELHGGSIGVTSPGPNRGTTFTVRLPRRLP